MMKNCFLLFFALYVLITGQVLGQESTGPVEVREGFGTSFVQNGKKLSPKQMLNLMDVNPAAYKEMEAAKLNNDWATAFGFAGGFLIGWPLGTAIGGGEPNWTLAGIGAGLVVVSIPFSTAYKKHALKAVDMYNNGTGEAGLMKLNYVVRISPGSFSLKIVF